MSSRLEDMDPAMDGASLYREDVFTDRKVGTIRVLTPVQVNGSPDLGRKILYVGEAQLLTTAGALPLTFEIDAKSLEEAVSGYAAAAKVEFEHAVQELQELRRQASSSIIVPDRGMGGLGPGGLPGGGRIKLT